MDQSTNQGIVLLLHISNGILTMDQAPFKKFTYIIPFNSLPTYEMGSIIIPIFQMMKWGSGVFK